MATYTAEVIVLNDRQMVRVCQGSRLIGYFRRVEDINDYGRPVDLADVEIKESTP